MSMTDTTSQLASRLRKLAVITGLLVPLLAGCRASETSGGKLRVVATTTQIGDFARIVGGDRISLTVLLKPNQDAHDFEPLPSQVRAVSRADVVLRNGIGLDAFVTKLIDASSEAEVVTVTDGLPLLDESGNVPRYLSGDDTGSDGYNPHVWFSVDNARRMVESVRDAFVRADPEGSQYYADNASRHLARLAELDSWIKMQVAQVPPACRKLVTDHDVFVYYAQAYGFTVVGSVVQGSSTSARPSASDVAGIVRRIRDEQVPAIFAEASVNPSLINQVAREAGVKVVADLYADSLGPKDSAGGTYIDMMESNTRKIVEALKDCPTR